MRKLQLAVHASGQLGCNFSRCFLLHCCSVGFLHPFFSLVTKTIQWKRCDEPDQVSRKGVEHRQTASRAEPSCGRRPSAAPRLSPHASVVCFLCLYCTLYLLACSSMSGFKQCPGFQMCPTKAVHAPNGSEAECEFCLGCGACQEELSKLQAAREKDKLVEEKSKEISHSSVQL